MSGNVIHAYFGSPSSFLWKLFQSLSRGNYYLLVNAGSTIYIFNASEEVIQNNQPVWLKVAQFLSGKAIL